jgi:hypothetical protein
MADFVAVLRKTLDGLAEATPEMRVRVYDKARQTVAARLAALNPPPPEPVAQRQRQALEDAIATVESEYAPAKPTFDDPLDELESVFAALKDAKPISSKQAAPPPPKPAVPLPPFNQPVTTETPAIAMPRAQQVEPLPFEDEQDDSDPFADEAQPEKRYDPPPRRRSYGGLVAAVLALLVLASGGYGIWLNKDEFSQMLGLNGSGQQPEPTDVATAPPADTPEPTQPAAQPADAATEQPPAGTDAADNAAQPETPPAEEGETKFTQRLNADGTEVDAGPAGGDQTFGEGTSVASLTAPIAADQPPVVPAAPATDAPKPASDAAAAPTDTLPPVDGTAPADPATAPETAAADPAAPVGATPPATAPGTATAPAATPVPVGQRAIFYEERTNVAQGSAEPGSIVWSEVQESPGADQPPEAAIRAEATIPGKDIQLRMTIRRNADKTLPASHIIEMIFLTPDGFEGGGIDNVLRVAMKTSEQDAGSPLIGIPAKIADGFFLVALNDSKSEIDANLNLMRRQSWIDIPIIYKNGRRALFTMEKGVPGEKVFNDTLKAWEPKTAG